MDIGAYIAASGAIAAHRNLEAVTHNLANAVTPGFKQVMIQLEAFPFTVSQRDPRRQEPLAFVLPRPPVRVDSQGTLERTDEPMDLALEGNGYFVVSTPTGTQFTRDGRFRIAQDGRLVTREGHPVLGGQGGQIRIEGQGPVSFGQNGEVRVGENTIGTLRIADGSGSPLKEGQFRVCQGFLEASNAKGVEGMVRILESLRSYQSYVKLMDGFSDLEGKMVQEMGRV